jgi:glycogen debranching enzyme
VRALLPALERALAWQRDYGMDGSGFLRYLDVTGHGLANQGWKDSVDSTQFRDGRLAEPPVALAEVQGYAVAAALAGADLLDAFDRPGADRWRDWAAALTARFRERFWVSDPSGRYPAMALDRAGVPVDAPGSNMGHLLGTGLLDAIESATVAARLGSAALSSGFGLRTLSSEAAGFNPLGYHTGSVWAHDTALAICGLSTAAAAGVTGAAAVAGTLIEGLLAAARGFDYRMPELHGGGTRDSGRPIPYPSACRPQAWSAASAVAVLTAILGPRPDAPSGRLEFVPLAPRPVGSLQVTGLRFGGAPLEVRLDAGGVRCHRQ